MKGIIVENNIKFCELFEPIINEFENLYWLADFQSCPFNFDWRNESEENEGFIEGIYIETPLLKNTSTQLWRPGTLPKTAPYIYFDEWSFLTGLKSTEDNIGKLITEFYVGQFLCRKYFESVDLYAQIFIVYVDGWWEIYTNHKQWFDLLAIARRKIRR
jgi:hypothetical protein